MKTTELEQYQDKLSDLLDEHFPKGKSKERGQAMVLVAYAVIEAEQLIREQREQEIDMVQDWNLTHGKYLGELGNMVSSVELEDYWLERCKALTDSQEEES